jgi:hypothetical protein
VTMRWSASVVTSPACASPSTAVCDEPLERVGAHAQDLARAAPGPDLDDGLLAEADEPIDGGAVDAELGGDFGHRQEGGSNRRLHP